MAIVILSKYLQHIVHTEPTRWQNKTCIELGAGTGIVACALASLGVPNLDIYSTDLAELLPLARKNVSMNGLEGKVKVEELYWGRPLPETVPHQPDLLLLADCIYVRSA
jgi:predicted RNA methylase